VLALFLVALALGLDNFAASIGIGLGGGAVGMRLRVAAVFGLFEAAAPLAGLALGRQLAHHVSGTTNYVGGGLLIATGVYTLVMARRRGRGEAVLGLRQLALTGLALSIDNFVVGLALGTYHVSFLLAAVVIAVVSVGLSLLGLEIGGRVGERLGESADLVGGAVLIAVGIAIAAGAL
jgi:putative Mn2+ efflux pump MntP